jgi:WD40 repeat protein
VSGDNIVSLIVLISCAFFSSFSFLLQLVSSGRDSTMRTWRPDIKAALNTAPDDQLPPPVEYFCNQTVRVASGNVTALAFSRKGMLASGGDDHVVSLWSIDSLTATISVVWTSRGKIDVHDGKPTEFACAPRFVISVVLVDFSQQEW